MKAWKEMSIDELAKGLGVSVKEVREKQKLTQLIVKTRRSSGLSQSALAKKVGVSQGRIAQIESGVGTAKVTFDVLLSVLDVLGYGFTVVVKRVG